MATGFVGQSRTPKGHAQDVRAAPAQVVHQRQRVRGHELGPVRAVVLRDAAVADAPVVKRAAPAARSPVTVGMLPLPMP